MLKRTGWMVKWLSQAILCLLIESVPWMNGGRGDAAKSHFGEDQGRGLKDNAYH